MKYKDQIKLSMENLAKDDKTLFIGYNVKYGNKGGGAFSNISENQLIETPPAENLMVGLATGLSIMKIKPVVYFERFDFILNGLDAIVNHLDKIDKLSDGQFQPKVIFRVVIGRECSPFFSGPTHTQDFTEAMKILCHFPVYRAGTIDGFQPLQIYERAKNEEKSCMIIERADNYEIEC